MAAVLLLIILSFAAALFAVITVRSSAEHRVFYQVNVRTSQVAMVLGARVDALGVPAPALLDRLQCGLELYRTGKVEYVLVSGDHGRDGYDEVNAMHAWLVDHGVPSDRVYLDHAGFRTLDSMVRARQVFAVRSMSVCTQRFHLARALWLAAAQGIDAVGVVSDSRVYQHRRRDAVREWFAQVRAFADTLILRTQPKFVGPRVRVGIDSSTLSHDSNTLQIRRPIR
jgi:SanA protein